MTINFGSGTVQHDTGTDTVNSLTTTNKLSLSGGTLTINGPSAINNDFTLSGGTLSGVMEGSMEKNVAATSTRRSHRQINCWPNFLDTRSES